MFRITPQEKYAVVVSNLEQSQGRNVRQAAWCTDKGAEVDETSILTDSNIPWDQRVEQNIQLKATTKNLFIPNEIFSESCSESGETDHIQSNATTEHLVNSNEIFSTSCTKFGETDVQSDQALLDLVQKDRVAVIQDKNGEISDQKPAPESHSFFGEDYLITSEDSRVQPSHRAPTEEKTVVRRQRKSIKTESKSIIGEAVAAMLAEQFSVLAESSAFYRSAIVDTVSNSINMDPVKASMHVLEPDETFLDSTKSIEHNKQVVTATVISCIDEEEKHNETEGLALNSDETLEPIVPSSPPETISIRRLQKDMFVDVPRRITSMMPIPQRLLNPEDSLFRSELLVLTLFPLLAAYYSFDIVAALTSLVRNDFNLTNSEFSQLYTIYEIPNIFMPLFAGAIIDKLGLRLATVLFMGTIVLGVSVTCAGPYFHSFPVMLSGRAVYGTGSESLQVAMDLIYSKWFVGRGLSFAAGLGTTAGRLGDVLAFNVGPLIADMTGDYRSALLAGVALTLAGFAASVAYFFLDRYQELRHGPSPHITRSIFSSVSNTPYSTSTDSLFGEPPTRYRDALETTKAIFRQVLSLPLQFWLVVIVNVSYYSTYFPFQAYAPSYFERKYGLSPDEAGRITGIMSLMSMFLCPISGLVIDKLGRRALAVSIAGSVMLLGLILLGFTDLHPAIGTSLIGIAFSVIPTTVWSALVIITADLQAIAFGLIQVLFNVGLAISYSAAGAVADGAAESLMAVPLMLTLLLLVGVVTSFIWVVVEHRSCSLANLTNDQLHEVREASKRSMKSLEPSKKGVKMSDASKKGIKMLDGSGTHRTGLSPESPQSGR